MAQSQAASRLQQLGSEHLVDNRVTAQPEHPAELRVRARQVGDVDQDVAAPDQVRRAGAGRDVFGRADLEDGAVRAGQGPGPLDVPGYRIDAGDVKAEALVQGHGLTALAAAHVEDDGAWR